jgi:hypothetical protein
MKQSSNQAIKHSSTQAIKQSSNQALKQSSTQALKHSRVLTLVALITLTSISESFGQVITRVLSPEDKIENYITWYDPDDQVPIVEAPTVDVEEVLQQDQEEGRLLSRISVNRETNISIHCRSNLIRGLYKWVLQIRLC